MVIAAAVGAVATVGGAVVSSSASKKASKTAQQTAATNNALQADTYAQNKAVLAPYVDEGNKANTAIGNLLGLDGATSQDQGFQDYLNSTGYQFQFDQGQKSVEAALGAKGLLDSGAALKGLNNYGQQQALSGFNNYMGLLTGQQGAGLTAASAQAGVAANYANSVSTNNNTAATASENATLSGASSINAALGNLVSGAALYGGLSNQSSYGANAALGGYTSTKATAPQYGFGPWA